MLGVAVMVGVMVLVSWGGFVRVGVVAADVGVSETGRKGVRVGLSAWIFVVGIGIASGTLHPDKKMLMKSIRTKVQLMLIQVPNLQLHFPYGFKQRTALLKSRFTQVAQP